MTDRPDPTTVALYARVSSDRQGGIEPKNTRIAGSRRGYDGSPPGVAVSVQVAEGYGSAYP